MLQKAMVILLMTVVATSLSGENPKAKTDAEPAGEAALTETSAAADAAAIRATALDYIEGWYEENAARMERSLHPELAKRIVRTSPAGKSVLDQMGALTLVQRTRSAGGKATPADQRQADVVILDVFENAASVRVTAASWVDYLHVARFDGRWVIVNVLWELKPKR
ncbi:MAG TPA: nuclear transport factor 2 family protein [Thermoanaerobaculia bacterium]|nr:nuclear transport factor 2 family protein [Thermoanaerobaculia bacterium]